MEAWLSTRQHVEAEYAHSIGGQYSPHVVTPVPAKSVGPEGALRGVEGGDRESHRNHGG